MALPLNLNLGPHTGQEYPFINIMRMGGYNPAPVDNSGNLLVDTNQYPKSGTLGQNLNGTCNLPVEFTDANTVWVVAWDGNMGSNASPAFQILGSGGTGITVVSTVKGGVSGSTAFNLNVYSTGGTGGYITFKFNTPKTTTMSWQFNSGAAFDGTLGNLRIYQLSQESALALSEFAPLFLAKIADLNPGSLRFLNWTLNNTSNLADVAAVTPTTAMNYSGTYFCPALWAGKTTGTNDYSATLAGASLADGQTLHLQVGTTNPSSAITNAVDNGNGTLTFTTSADISAYAVTGRSVLVSSVVSSGGTSPQFNNAYVVVSSTSGSVTVTKLTGQSTGTYTSGGTIEPGIKFALNGGSLLPVLDTFGVPLASSTTWIANAVWTLTYNALLNSWVALKNGVQQGVPLSVCIDLCNVTGKDLWFNIPSISNVALFNYQMGLINSRLTKTAWLENGNEIWNKANGGFAFSFLYSVIGTALGFPTSNSEYFHGVYALRICQLYPLLPALFGGNTSRYKRVFAFQAAADYATVKQFRFEAYDCNPTRGFSGYNSLVNIDYTVVGKRPCDLTDYISYAIYSHGAQLQNFDANYTSAMTTDGPTGYTVGLLGAADDYATGVAANMANALAWVDWDLRQGTRSSVAGSSTLLAFASGSTVNASGVNGICPSWHKLAQVYGQKVALYEAAMENAALSTSKCTNLGISTTYGGVGGKIDILLVAYKNSQLFALFTQDLIRTFSGFSSSAASSQYEVAAADQWSLYPNTLTGTPFKSYDAVKNVGQSKRLIRSTG